MSAIEHHNSMPVANPRNDLTGERFGKLVVTGNPRTYPMKTKKRVRWECICDCGNISFVDPTNLKNGTTKSCGCDHMKQGGLAKSERGLYDVWRLMHRRCYDPRTKSFADYGAKGVKVCERWHEFKNFVEDMKPRPDGMTLDRHQPDWKPGDDPLEYSPKNCRWATRRQQQNNTTKNAYIEFNGDRLTSAQWSRRTGIASSTIRFRIRNGWSVEEALTTEAVVGRNAR